MTEPTDTADLKRFADRWVTVSRMLRPALLRLGVAPAEVDDVLQDVALKLLRRADILGNDMDHFTAMARNAAHWAAIDRFRAQPLREMAADPATLEALAPAHTPDPTVGLAFEQAWRRLTERERQLLEMRHAGHSDEEIGAALGVSPATVRSMARRVRAKAIDLLF